jgi:GC-rich sequence DNA-binding factor
MIKRRTAKNIRTRRNDDEEEDGANSSNQSNRNEETNRQTVLTFSANEDVWHFNRYNHSLTNNNLLQENGGSVALPLNNDEERSVHQFTSSSTTRKSTTRDKSVMKRKYGTKHSTTSTSKKKPMSTSEKQSLIAGILASDEQSIESQSSIEQPKEHVPHIPDKFTIEQAKLKRKHAQHNADYIPLEPDESNNRRGIGSQLATISDNGDRRLVTEEDADSDNDEVFDEWKGNRISFGKPVSNIKPNISMEIEESDDDDEDEAKELDKFELAQLKNAGIIKHHEHDEEDDTVDEYELKLRKMNEKKLKQKIHSYSKLDDERAVMSFEQVENALRSSLLALEADHEHTQNTLDHTNREIEANATTISFLQRELSDLSEQFIFFQQMKEYLEDLIECLDTKVPVIENIEEQVLTLRSQYHASLYNDWIQMMEDELKLEENSGMGTQEKIIRQQRRESRNLKHNTNRNKWIAELDYYDSLESQRFVQYNKTIDGLVGEASHIFDDVEDDYCNIDTIKSKFENWKYIQPSSYRDTYCGTYVRKIFAPFVRLELIGLPTGESQHITEVSQWKYDPFHAATLSIFNWWNTLLYYGIDANSDVMSDAEQTPEDIVPELIRKVAVPVIIHSFDHVYNPLSVQNTTHAVKLVHELLDYLEPDSDEMKRIYVSISRRISQFVTDIQLPRTTSSEAGMIFLMKQLDACLTLITSAVAWSECFDINVMSDVITENLMKRKIIETLQHNQILSSQEKNEFVQQVLLLGLPDDWRKLMTM